MGDRFWSEKDARETFIARLSGADYEYLREYLSEHKIPPGTLSVNELKRILVDWDVPKKAVEAEA